MCDVDVEELKSWFFEENNGFVDEVYAFAAQAKNLWGTENEEHSLEMTALHKKFQDAFEAKVQSWLDQRGCTMDGLQDSLKVVDTGADPAADVMVGVMLAMLDYEQFAATMRTIAQEDALLFGTASSVLDTDSRLEAEGDKQSTQEPK